MLESQLASYVEYKRKGLGNAGNDIWSKFQLALPHSEFIANRLSEVEQKM